MSATLPLRQRRKEARPQELLDAALALFVEKGFVATRSEEVAARAGVSKGTLYLYYPSKEELLKAVIRHQLSSEIAAGALEVERYVGPTAKLLVDVLSQWWQRVFDSPASGVFKLVVTEVRGFPEIADFYVQEVVEPGERVIGSIVQRGIDRGEFRPLDVSTVVHSLVLPMVMLCLHKHSIGACTAHKIDLDPHRFIRDHIELMLNGMLAGEAKGHREIESPVARTKSRPSKP
jgi:AcrR family transcriptional regulator